MKKELPSVQDVTEEKLTTTPASLDQQLITNNNQSSKLMYICIMMMSYRTNESAVELPAPLPRAGLKRAPSVIPGLHIYMIN